MGAAAESLTPTLHRFNSRSIKAQTGLSNFMVFAAHAELDSIGVMENGWQWADEDSSS